MFFLRELQTPTKRGSARGLCLLIAGLLWHGAGRAESALPLKIQALLVKKTAGFDRAFESKPLKVAVVHQRGADENVAEVLAAFNAVGVPAVSLSAAEFKADGLDITAAFLLPGGVTPSVLAEAEKLQLLTFSSTLQPVLDGKVAMAFGLREDGKPQIVVHLARSKQQGRSLSSDLLNLARIIR